MCLKPPRLSAQARFFAKCLPIFISILFLATRLASAADPLGATLHKDGTTTFRVWAPFVDSVAVRINGGAMAPLTQEPGHPDPADTTWAGTVPGTKAGDQYRYVITLGGVAREFNDPRAQQLTGFDLPNGYGLPGNDDKPQSVIVDPNFSMPAFTEPTFNAMVIYELHIGTFGNTFAGAVQKLDYLKNLGINAVEVLPITQNPLFSDHIPPDHDWGYDPVQLFAVKSKYGTPQEFKEFVKQCHQRQIAVIVDVVYNHVIGNNLLKGFGGFTTPQIPGGIFLYGGDRANTGFGPRPDYGRPQVRQYIIDNALLLLRDYGVDGLRFDDTIDIRTFGQPRAPNNEGAELLREINSAYRNTDPKQPGKITIAEDLQSSGDVTLQSGPTGLEFNSPMGRHDGECNARRGDQGQRFGSRPWRRRGRARKENGRRRLCSSSLHGESRPGGSSARPEPPADVDRYKQPREHFRQEAFHSGRRDPADFTWNPDDFSGPGDAGDSRLRLQHADQHGF